LRDLNEIIPWETFRECLDQLHPQERKSQAGRKPIDRLMLFKLLILQQLDIFKNKKIFQANLSPALSGWNLDILLPQSY